MLNYFMTVRTHISYWRNITWETTLTPVVVVTAASAVFGRCEGTWTPAKFSKLCLRWWCHCELVGVHSVHWVSGWREGALTRRQMSPDDHLVWPCLTLCDRNPKGKKKNHSCASLDDNKTNIEADKAPQMLWLHLSQSRFSKVRICSSSLPPNHITCLCLVLSREQS